jgi:hypothetical protein
MSLKPSAKSLTKPDIVPELLGKGMENNDLT